MSDTQSIAGFSRMPQQTSLDIYDDQKSSLRSAGLKQTSLNTAMAHSNKKYNRPKTTLFSNLGMGLGNGSAQSISNSGSFYGGPPMAPRFPASQSTMSLNSSSSYTSQQQYYQQPQQFQQAPQNYPYQQYQPQPQPQHQQYSYQQQYQQAVPQMQTIPPQSLPNHIRRLSQQASTFPTSPTNNKRSSVISALVEQTSPSRAVSVSQAEGQFTPDSLNDLETSIELGAQLDRVFGTSKEDKVHSLQRDLEIKKEIEAKLFAENEELKSRIVKLEEQMQDTTLVSQEPLNADLLLQIESLQQKLEKMEEQLRCLNSMNEELSAKSRLSGNMTLENKNLKLQIQRLEEHTDQLTAVNDELTMKVSEYQDKYSDSLTKLERMGSIHKAHEVLRREHDQLREIHQASSEDAAQSHAQLSMQLRDSQEENASLKTAHETVKQESAELNQELQAQLSALKEEHTSLISNKEAELSQLQVQIEHLRTTKESTVEQLTQLQAQLVALKVEHSELEKAQVVTKSETEKQATTLRDLRSTHEQALADLASTKKRIAELSEENDALRDVVLGIMKRVHSKASDIATFEDIVGQVNDCMLNEEYNVLYESLSEKETRDGVNIYNKGELCDTEPQLLQVFREEVRQLSYQLQLMHQQRTELENRYKEQLSIERKTTKQIASALTQILKESNVPKRHAPGLKTIKITPNIPNFKREVS